MSDKLFELCEQQLLSIIKDAEVSTARIVNDTTVAVRDSAKLCERIEQLADLNADDKTVSDELQNRLNTILVNMQYFDEFSQRIQHIKEIVGLLKLESDREGFLSDPRCSEELFKDVSSIFSIRSEFEVLEQIFPETRKIDASEMVELF